MSDFFGKLKSGAEKVAFEAEKMTKMTRSKNELENLKNQLRDQFAKLGQAYYAQRATTGVAESGFDELYQSIAEKEKLIESKTEEIKQLDAQEYVPEGAAPKTQSVPPAVPPAAPADAPAAAAATKFCPNCGKEVMVATKFCPDCGTAL